jgi:hypothetical protein
MDAISKNHDSKIIHGQYTFVLTFFFITLESYLFFLFFYVSLQGITKDAFVVDVIQFMLEHCQIFTFHTTKVVEAIAKYCTNMGIASSSSSLEE